jgi:hypothetical protein
MFSSYTAPSCEQMQVPADTAVVLTTFASAGEARVCYKDKLKRATTRVIRATGDTMWAVTRAMSTRDDNDLPENADASAYIETERKLSRVVADSPRQNYVVLQCTDDSRLTLFRGTITIPAHIRV